MCPNELPTISDSEFQPGDIIFGPVGAIQWGIHVCLNLTPLRRFICIPTDGNSPRILTEPRNRWLWREFQLLRGAEMYRIA